MTGSKTVKNERKLFAVEGTKRQQSMHSYERVSSKACKCSENYLEKEKREMKVVDHHTIALTGKLS